MTAYRKEGTFEKPYLTMNGIALLLLLIALALLFAASLVVLRNPLLAVPLGLAIFFIAPGFFMLQPNHAAVLLLFGKYLGTERSAGLRWTLPWNMRRRT